MNKRIDRLMPNEIPRYIRCYDNGGKTFDRYTVVYTGNYKKNERCFMYVGMSANPFHPQGYGLHDESQFTPIDRPKYSHLGKKITFEQLPKDCQKLVLQDYKDIWELTL